MGVVYQLVFKNVTCMYEFVPLVINGHGIRIFRGVNSIRKEGKYSGNGKHRVSIFV